MSVFRSTLTVAMVLAVTWIFCELGPWSIPAVAAIALHFYSIGGARGVQVGRKRLLLEFQAFRRQRFIEAANAEQEVKPNA